MKKSWILIICITAVIGAAVLYVMMTRSAAPDKTAKPQPASDLPAAASEQPQQAPMSQTPGIYKDYDAADVATNTGRKVLFFYAPWCPQCRALEQSIQAGTIPSGVTIYKTDFDSSTELRQKYGVNLQTTLVEIDSNGTKIRSYTAYDTPNLATVIAEMKL